MVCVTSCQEAHRAKSVFSCQMAKVKLDFRAWQGYRGETVLEEKSGTGLKKLTRNIISHSVSHQGEKNNYNFDININNFE